MSSLNVVNQKAYLKKYLGVGKTPGVKKKKKDNDSAKRLKIIDDDIDDYNISKEIQLDIDAADEDAPQIVAVIDERPPSLRVDEKTNNLLWKPLGDDNDIKVEVPMKMNSFQLKKPTLDNIFLNKKIPKEIFKKNNTNTKKSLECYQNKSDVNTGSPSCKYLEEYVKKEQDYSPPRKEKRSRSNFEQSSPTRKSKEFTSRKYGNSSPRKRTNNNDLDISPPRSKNKECRERYISPATKKHRSPPSREDSDKDHSPVRKVDKHSPLRMTKKEPSNCNADISCSIRIKMEDSDRERDTSSGKKHLGSPFTSNRDMSPARKIRSNNSDEDVSSPRRNKSNSSSKIDNLCKDLRKRFDVDDQGSRNKRYTDSDGDISPPRKKKNRDSPSEDYFQSNRNGKNPKGNHRNTSPSRKIRQEEQDMSPPRRHKDLSPSRKNSRRDEDNSSPRCIKKERSNSSDRRKKDRQTHSRWSDLSPDCDETIYSKKPEKTMGGKRAGLQTAKELGKEIAILKAKEDLVFKNMSEEVSGRNATTVIRGQKPKDPVEEARRLQKEKEIQEKYDRWGRGLKQVESESQKMADQLYEMSKPLARYADDEDLEKYLKEQEREGDPMLDYIRKKKKKKNTDAGIPEKPMYMGEFMPNRFGIKPGYRWDGVDRSNEYETKWFEKLNARKAVQEEAFKWSTEDM